MAGTNFAKIGYVNAQEEFEDVKLRAQDVQASTGVTAEAHITDTAAHLTTAQATAIAGAVQSSALGAANGVATLDASGKVSSTQIPAALTGHLNYQGVFNPVTGLDGDGTAIPTAASANKGFYWIANNVKTNYRAPGNSADINIAVGDWIVSNGTTYDEIDNTTTDIVARNAAETAQEEAELLDAAYCLNEADMAAKNLRVGAFVLMAATNTAP